MQTHWSKYLTLSIVHFMAFPETIRGEGPIVETVTQIARDDFFTGIEITRIMDPEKRTQVRAILESAHLAGAFGAQPALIGPRLDLNAADPEARQRAVQQMYDCVDQAADLGLTRLSLLGGWDPGPALRQEAHKLLLDSVLKVCDYADEKGIAVALETFDREVDTRALLGPAEEAVALSEQVKREFPNFGLLYDLSHQPLLKEEVGPTLALLQGHLEHIHVGNCVTVPGRAAFGDKHPRFGFAGSETDVEQLAAFLRGLFAIGYLKENHPGEKPWVGIEVKPQPGESSELLLAGTRRVWTEAWARI